MSASVIEEPSEGFWEPSRLASPRSKHCCPSYANRILAELDHHPVRSTKEASRYFIEVAATPPRRGGVNARPQRVARTPRQRKRDDRVVLNRKKGTEHKKHKRHKKRCLSCAFCASCVPSLSFC